MIYTLTLNPSIDYIVTLPTFETGKINRTESDFKFVGGKGINVSKVLNNLCIKSVALGFVGGFTGEHIANSLKNDGIETDFTWVTEDSRINVKVKSSAETEINGLGPNITEDNLNDLFMKLDKLKKGDILILAGSIQKNLPKTLYSTIQTKVSKLGVKVIVDTCGEALIESLKNNPFLVKPNSHEVEEIFNTKINDEKTLIEYGLKLHNLGAENVIISRAEDGALLINKNGVFKGNCPQGTVINSVGAGDSLIGGFISQFVKGHSILDSFKTGIAAGSASAFSMDLCKEDEVLKLIEIIKVERL